METTKNDLTNKAKHFFKSLSDYLDTKLLFFGSVQRRDYVPGHSDIDIDIFTENEQATIAKLQHFLHVKRNKFKKTEWVLDNISGNGYKVKYKDENINAEFSIYNERFKEIILQKHISKFDLPFIVSVLLCLLKLVYYKLGILSKSTYIYLKDKLLNDAIGTENDRFIVLEET